MRIGFAGSLCDGFKQVTWFGGGPHEAYLDRHDSVRIAVHEGRRLNVPRP